MTFPNLFYNSRPLDTSPETFGRLRDSSDAVGDPEEMRRRIDEDGYLFLPGLLDRDQVREARVEALRRLDRLGYIDRAYPLEDGVAAPHADTSSNPDLARDNAPLHRVLYDGALMEFHERFLGGPVRHFDFTWFRAKAPGQFNATWPHYDVVYMGRGTKNLYTTWTPLGDIPLVMGGLMVLENSHRLEPVKSTYGTLDVDTYCAGTAEEALMKSGETAWDRLWAERVSNGEYTKDAVALPREFGLRWLSADYQMGDALVFGMYLMHASMDNQTNRFRLSSDSRYQRADEPADERWIGESPIGHGPEGKRALIC
jgi:hypothetical protein